MTSDTFGRVQGAVMNGHGTFIYEPDEAKAKHGSWEGAAQAVKHLDMSHAWIRCHDKNGLWRKNENKALAAALKAQGIAVYGWGWCDGNAVDRDVANVQATLDEFELDGYIADIEHGVAGANWNEARVDKFSSNVRKLLGEKPFLVSTFGFVPYHKPKLMQAAEPHVDGFAPQVYWFWYPNKKMFSQPGAKPPYRENNAADYARLCIDVWRAVVSKPLVLTGQLYWGEAENWDSDDAEQKLAEFIADFEDYDRLIGLNWWHLAGSKAMSAKMTAMLAVAKLNSRFNTGQGEV